MCNVITALFYLIKNFNIIIRYRIRFPQPFEGCIKHTFIPVQDFRLIIFINYFTTLIKTSYIKIFDTTYDGVFQNFVCLN